MIRAILPALAVGMCCGTVAALIVGLSLGPTSSNGDTSPASAWTPPALVTPTTIQLSDTTRNLKLDQAKDYTLTCANPVQATWGLVVYGGHNVTLEHCDYVNSAASYGAQFKDQTGTLYLHDVHFAGSALTEGIDLQEPGTTTVVMRDVLIDTLHGSYTTNHADCLQTWSGPQRLLVDGFTCTSQYQGMFLLPNQHDTSTVETIWDFRHINLHLSGAYAFTLSDVGPAGSGSLDLNTDHIYADGSGEPRLYPGGQGFEDANAGIPTVGDYVTPTASGAVGVDEPPVDPTPSSGE